MSNLTESNLRTVLKVAGTFFLTRGYADSAAVEAGIGLALALAGWLCSYAHHSDTPPTPKV